MRVQRASRSPTRSVEGSENVFADIGIPEPDLALAKVCLAEKMDDTIRERGLTQDRAAEILGIDQGTVSKLVNGRLDGFSLDRLIRYLTSLGHDVEILVRDVEVSGNPGKVRVGGSVTVRPRG